MIKDIKNTLLFIQERQQEAHSDVQSMIDPELFERFKKLDYIRRSENKWKTTTAGEEELQFYCCELTPEEKEIAHIFDPH